MLRSKSTAHSAYSAALKVMEKRPTVKALPFLLRYRPRMSSPPVEQPQVKIRPLEKPARMPPTRQEVSLSAMMGAAGEGITANASELTTVPSARRTTNWLPSVRHASHSMGMFTSRYSTPARSKGIFTPMLVTTSVRITWHRPYSPPL